MNHPENKGHNKNDKHENNGRDKDDIVIARCQSCGEEIYYLVTLSKGELKAVESVCPSCGYRHIGLTGELKLVEELLHNTAVSLKKALENKGINASIEIKISLDDTGTWVRVKDSASAKPM